MNIEKMREALEMAMRILGDAPDLNPSSYAHEEACKLNTAANEAYIVLDAALTHHQAESEPSGRALAKSRDEWFASEDGRLEEYDMLTAAPSIAEKWEWINCEERLPTEEDAFVEDIVWACQIDKWGIPTAKLRGVLDVFPGDHITHWMPTGLRRPEPPEVQS